MAETAPPQQQQQPKIRSIRSVAESSALNPNNIPDAYIVTPKSNPDDHDQELSVGQEKSIPVIDYSLLLSPSQSQRSKTIQELGKACQDWGFFMVINHGVPERLMASMLEASRGFFELAEEEKQEYEGKHVLDAIRYGTSFNASVEQVFFWRDFLKIFVHPVFHSPSKPAGFRETSLEYARKVREVAREVLKGISQSLGLEGNYIENELDVEQGLQIFIANFYPSCPQPELAMGMPPHSDHGLLTLLIQNRIGGLQIYHKGKWIDVDAIPNSFLVNTGDHLEILSNGKYKSVLHRAMVNEKATRISIAMAHGPSLDSVVSPSPMLLQDCESNGPAFIAMKYKDYLHLQQSNKLDGKSCLERVRI